MGGLLLGAMLRSAEAGVRATVPCSDACVHMRLRERAMHMPLRYSVCDRAHRIVVATPGSICMWAVLCGVICSYVGVRKYHAPLT